MAGNGGKRSDWIMFRSESQLFKSVCTWHHLPVIMCQLPRDALSVRLATEILISLDHFLWDGTIRCCRQATIAEAIAEAFVRPQEAETAASGEG